MQLTNYMKQRSSSEADDCSAGLQVIFIDFEGVPVHFASNFPTEILYLPVILPCFLHVLSI